MVEDTKIIFSNFGEEYSKIEKKDASVTDEVILFFSYDIVNSSSFKSTYPFRWSTIITGILVKVKKRVEMAIPNVELWRILGDEAVFVVRIKRNSEIYDDIDKIYSILMNAIHDIKNGTLMELGQEESDEYSSENELKVKGLSLLSLKATAWIALVKTSGKATGSISENIRTEYLTYENNKITEFLGNDIDAGFRLCKCSTRRRLILSFELAKLLSEKTEYLQRLFIITYTKLKGIWQDRLYPVIWYYDKKLNNDIEFDDSFDYDENISDQLVQQYINNKKCKYIYDLPNFMYDNVNKAFNKLLKDMGLEGKLLDIKEHIPNDDKAGKGRRLVQNAELLELHCVAVCFDESSKKIIIFKRKSDRQFKPGEWEFGCAKANLNSSIQETLVNEYQNDFNIHIEPILKDDREDIEPYPLAIYKIVKINGNHKGIITLAKIIGNYEILKFVKTSKHDEARWISENEIDTFTEPAVPDFKATLKQSFEVMKKIEKSKEV